MKDPLFYPKTQWTVGELLEAQFDGPYRGYTITHYTIEVNSDDLWGVLMTDNDAHILTHSEIDILIQKLRIFYSNISPERIEQLNTEQIKRINARQNSMRPVASNRTPRGYVYLLQAGPYYKIGVSADPDKRLEQLSTIPPFDIELLHTIETPDMYALEFALHERFADKRKNGERFELCPADVEYIKGL